MRNFVLAFILLISVGFANELKSENLKTSDSIRICKIIFRFYDWYISAIKNHKYEEYQPRFSENKEGMTNIEYSEYLEKLKRLQFSNELIEKEKNSYQSCMNNLKNIPYKEFERDFGDLSDFERTNCDFSNYFRWFGGQEPIDGIRIKNVNLIDNENVQVSIEYYNEDSDSKSLYYWGTNIITMQNQMKKWKINYIESFELAQIHIIPLSVETGN